MEQRITSLLLPAPEAELEASCKELDSRVTWLLHNNRKMDNYLELETFSKDERLCGYVCDTLRSLPEIPTLAAYKDYKAIIVLLGISTTHYAILDELAEQHRKRNDIPELTAYCDALHWMRPGRQYLCNVYNTVCHAFHLLRRNPVKDNVLLVSEKELRHAERMLPELGKQTFTEMVRLRGYKVYDAEELAEKCGMEYGSFRRKMKKVTGYTPKEWVGRGTLPEKHAPHAYRSGVHHRILIDLEPERLLPGLPARHAGRNPQEMAGNKKMHR